MKLKRSLKVVTFGLTLLFCAFAVNGVLEERAEAKRMVQYRLTTDHYSQAFRPGTAAADVQVQLKEGGKIFGERCCYGPERQQPAYLLQIGQGKAPWFCGAKNIYVAFLFERRDMAGTDANVIKAADRLSAVQLLPQLEQCL